MGKLIKVMVFGTFDILHPGHLHFLQQAKSLGDFLIVSVARDANVKKIKGRTPLFDEKERLEIIASIGYVDKAILGDTHGYLRHVLKEKPDIIALGYDQKAYIDALKADIVSGKLEASVVRLQPHHPQRYKSKMYRGY